MSRRLLAAALVCVLWVTLTPPAKAGVQGTSFRWVEATIADIHVAFASGELTCEELVNGYLARVTAFDRSGPTLQSVLTVNPKAVEQARQLDARYATDGPIGALHCVPILLKDNIDTADMPTTAGSRSLRTSRPPDDAFAVARLRQQGALILGKANMDEFAFGFGGSSSLGGQVRNPYDPARGPGGSSSGTGASIAASLAMVGVGSDTGGSIRVPSSVQGLVGIRPSLRLVSGDGVIPLARFQDVIGPMCRTVQDCAAMLDAMVGFDGSAFSGQHTKPLQRDDEAVLMTSDNQYQSVTGVDPGHSYTAALAADGLRGARIGVVRALFGGDPDVTRTMNAAILAMRGAGATVEDVIIPDLSTITGYASVSAWEFRDHLSSYLQSWPSTADGHRRSFEEIMASGEYEQARASTFALYAVQGATRGVDPAYEKNTHERSAYVPPRLRAALDNTTLEGAPRGEPYDALLYPSVLSPPQVGGAPSTGSNNRLSPFSGFPALSMPAGFTAATDSTVALPIGMELLGREFDEATLLRLAYGYEHAVAGTPLARQAPTFTPELGTPGPTAPRLMPTATRDAGLVAPSELHRQ
jgi:Asp-tRNA(Asn)/Glu-tRNA(Gln) amidotransferase A subunit family amidase